MYAAPFDYVRASSWPEAVERLAEGGDDARVIAGGQSLVPMMMLRLTEPRLLVDVGGADSRTIERSNGRLILSALVRHSDLEASSDVREARPVLADAAAHIGNVRVRNRGTIGGSLAHGEPTAELACLAVALGARLRVLGPEGERTIPADEFFVSHFTTALAGGEVITTVEIPVAVPGEGAGFAELTRRAGDFALVEVAAVLGLDRVGTCRDARVVVGATAERPLAMAEAEVLVGREATERTFAEVGKAVAHSVEIGSSDHASESYRREMVAVLVRRALRAAAGRARGIQDLAGER